MGKLQALYYQEPMNNQKGCKVYYCLGTDLSTYSQTQRGAFHNIHVGPPLKPTSSMGLCMLSST